MAKKAPQVSAASTAADAGAVIPRLSLGEQGFIGLRVINNQILEEAQRSFRFPAFLKTVSEMKNDVIIASAFSTYRMFISRVNWTVKPPEDATQEQKDRAKFIAQQMDDMEGSWSSFISNILSYLEYGFAIEEKVYRRRLRKNGSRYNDGLVGLRKLSPRGQDTIRFWTFSEDGRELLGVEQSVINLEGGFRYTNLPTNEKGTIPISRDKFLLFTADSTKDNPQGNSLLKGVYLAWKQMQLLKDQEILSIAKEAAGLPLIQIPPKYMSADASIEDKAVYDSCKTIINNLAAGTQRGVLFPKMIDPETKADLFNISLLEKKVTGTNNLDGVIKRYTDEIRTALHVDIPDTGTIDNDFSINSCALSVALSHRLNEIADVLNNDLIPQLFALNGWTDEELPKFVPSSVADISPEEFSKYIQRVASVGLLEVDRDVLNRVREIGGIPQKPSDEPVDMNSLSTNTSNAGEGMAPGTTGNGTEKIGGNHSKQDPSSNNADNKA